MAKKTKVLTKSAVAAALAATAVVPVIAAPASAATAPVTEVVYVVDGKNVSLSFATFTDALNAEVLNNLDIKYVKAADGNYYSFEDFSDAINASDSVDAALELLANNAAELAKELTDVVEGTVGEDGNVTPPATTELAVASVSAINKTKVEVKLSKEVDSVTAENFTIEGGNVTAATLADDKKTVTLTVSGLKYGTEYTVTTKDLLVDGKASDFGSKTFTTPAVTDLWELQISTLDASLVADGSDNTEVTFKLVDKTTGQVDTAADNVVLDLNTTYGTLASKRITVQDGVATVLLTSEFSNTDISAKIDAQIIEASGDYKELINHVAGTVLVPFKTTTTENVETVTLVAAEANQADRVTLFFDKEITLKHFVAVNDKGELQYTQYTTAGTVVSDSVLGKTLVDAKVPAELISHTLINSNNVKIAQEGNTNFKIKGFKPVAGNSKAIEVILDKNTVLKDNADVKIDVITVNSLKKETNSSASFKVTDARKPEATSVTTEGLNTLKVKFSEAIDEATFQIDGQFKGVPVGTSSTDLALLSAKEKAFTYEFGEFNPVTLADNRDLATITLTSDYLETGDKKVAGYFGAGTHTIQTSSTKDFAYKTDRNNIGSTQNLNFNIAADSVQPTATVTVESPEQFRLKFDKAISATEAQVQDLINPADPTVTPSIKLQVKNATNGNYVDAAGLPVGEGRVLASELEVTRVSATEFVIELKKDWTHDDIHDTDATNKNYYNYEYQLLIAKDTFTNVANGLKNEELKLNLSYAGSPLTTPDTTSPIISNVERVGVSNILNVTMNEPVKLVPTGTSTVDNAGDTLAQKQNTLTTTTVQFLGKDKDGKTVTINGNVGNYIAAGNESDSKFSISWNDTATVTPQSVVDEGGSTEWTVVIRNISDDVGNDASSATFKINLEKSAAGSTPFFIEKYTAADGAVKAGKHKVEGASNGTGLDTITITFSEGVRYSGNSDATDPANYTLNGVTLPTGTSISVSDVDLSDKGLETVTITLPDGTLNTGIGYSNVLTVNKNLISHDDSKIEGDTTVIVNLAENLAVSALQAAIPTATVSVVPGTDTPTSAEVDVTIPAATNIVDSINVSEIVALNPTKVTVNGTDYTTSATDIDAIKTVLEGLTGKTIANITAADLVAANAGAGVPISITIDNKVYTINLSN